MLAGLALSGRYIAIGIAALPFFVVAFLFGIDGFRNQHGQPLEFKFRALVALGTIGAISGAASFLLWYFVEVPQAVGTYGLIAYPVSILLLVLGTSGKYV